MSAPQIPNLNTFRRGAPRGRLRGGRGDHAGAGSHADGRASKDKVVQQTDDDASASRLSAVELGYLHDPFARAVMIGGAGVVPKRYPLINRGTYVRTTAIDSLVAQFLDLDGDNSPRKRRQIISLGAGSDTRIFRLLSEHPSLDIVYHELDFSVNTAAKIKAIRSSQLLLDSLRISGPGDVKISLDGDALHSRFLHIHPVDLRKLAHPSAEADILPGVDTTIPTLLISECCLIYLSPTEAVNVLNYFTKTLFPQSPTPSPPETPREEASTPLGLIIYEPIRPNDPFGKTMVSNLAVRGIHLQTLHRYASLEAERERMREHGLGSGQGAADVDSIWEKWVSAREKERVAGLEMLDEIEEWKLLAGHYCVAWGWREEGSNGNDGRGVFEGWKGVVGQRIGYS